MGFFDAMGKMIQGKPVFQDDPTKQGAQQEDHFVEKNTPRLDTSHTPLDGHGQKIIPEITVTRVEGHVSGDNLDLWVTIHNSSEVSLFIDKIHVLGQKMDLNYDLAPGMERQMSVYKGPTLRTNAYTNADVDYRVVETGDYFQARFYVEYDFEQDGTYLPNDFNLQRPIRDI